VHFVDDFFFNLSYKNAYSLCFQPLLVQMYMDVQLDDEWIRVKGDPLVYTVRWMLERVTQLINVVYAIKES